MDKMEQIRKPIEADLERYLSLFEKDFTHENPLLHLALQHIRKRQGKRLRPILTLLSAAALGKVEEAVLHACVSLELVHTASLVHDDIVDESNMRRGQESVNVLLSPQAAVLVGDYLLAKSLQHSAQTRNVDVVSCIAAASELLSDGELIQLYALDSDKIEESVYYKVIERKTASLFSTCAKLGAMLGGGTPEQIEVLRLFGEYLGVAFQIRDDMLDYTDSATLGKPAGNDMVEGKLTLPVIYVVNKSADEAMFQLALKVRRTEASAEEIAQLVKFTLEQGGLEYAAQCMEQYAARACDLLSRLPQSEYTEALRQFAGLVVKRDK